MGGPVGVSACAARAQLAYPRPAPAPRHLPTCPSTGPSGYHRLTSFSALATACALASSIAAFTLASSAALILASSSAFSCASASAIAFAAASFLAVSGSCSVVFDHLNARRVNAVRRLRCHQRKSHVSHMPVRLGRGARPCRATHEGMQETGCQLGHEAVGAMAAARAAA